MKVTFPADQGQSLALWTDEDHLTVLVLVLVILSFQLTLGPGHMTQVAL